MNAMHGWTADGTPVTMLPEQAHAVLVMLGYRDPDARFYAFWRRGHGGGKTTALVTAGRYAQIEGEYHFAMTGLGDLAADSPDVVP